MSTNQKSKRGRFRQMSLAELKRAASESIWDDEQTSLSYSYPLPTDETITSQGSRLAEDIPKEQLRKIGPFLTAISPDTHIGPYTNAIDFLVPDGTAVFAAQDGKITEVVDIFVKWGDGEEFRDYLNFITLAHGNGEISQYCHLQQGSVRLLGLRIGNVVKKGQQIGKVGKTGWTDRDHLHFVVYRIDSDPNNPFRFKSLKTNFE